MVHENIEHNATANTIRRTKVSLETKRKNQKLKNMQALKRLSMLCHIIHRVEEVCACLCDADHRLSR